MKSAAKAIGVLLAVSTTACAQVRGAVSKLPQSRAMGGYEPVAVTSVDELPAPVVEAVGEHLRQRLGTAFFDELRFAGGEVVEFAELYRVNPAARDYKWVVPKYRLFFSYFAPDVGITEYRAEIELDENGAVIKEIDLPRVAEQPTRGKFVPFRVARAAAHRQRFDATKVRLQYMDEFDSVVWRFERWDGTAHRYMAVSAHTAAVLAEWGAVPVY